METNELKRTREIGLGGSDAYIELSREFKIGNRYGTYEITLTTDCIGNSTIAGDHLPDIREMVFRATNFLNALHRANDYTAVL